MYGISNVRRHWEAIGIQDFGKTFSTQCSNVWQYENKLYVTFSGLYLELVGI